MAVDLPPDQPHWVPDLQTVRWAAAQIQAESLARAMEHDVPLRIDLPPELPPDLWAKAADAAYEATWWPLIQAAEKLNGLRGTDQDTPHL